MAEISHNEKVDYYDEVVKMIRKRGFKFVELSLDPDGRLGEPKYLVGVGLLAC